MILRKIVYRNKLLTVCQQSDSPNQISDKIFENKMSVYVFITVCVCLFKFEQLP